MKNYNNHFFGISFKGKIVKKIILFLLIGITISIFSEPLVTGDYGIVFKSENELINVYKDANLDSEAVFELSPGVNLKTTWKTEKNGDDYFIHISCDKGEGWVLRDDLTHKIVITDDDILNIEKILIDVVAAFQNNDPKRIEKYVYSLRGLTFYCGIDEIMHTLSHKKFQDEFVSMFIRDAGNPFMRRTWIRFKDNVSSLLEGEFKIYYKKNEIEHYISDFVPLELKNFPLIVLESSKSRVYFGLEYWKDRYFISYIAFER